MATYEVETPAGDKIEFKASQEFRYALLQRIGGEWVIVKKTAATYGKAAESFRREWNRYGAAPVQDYKMTAVRKVENTNEILSILNLNAIEIAGAITRKNKDYALGLISAMRSELATLEREVKAI